LNQVRYNLPSCISLTHCNTFLPWLRLLRLHLLLLYFILLWFRISLNNICRNWSVDTSLQSTDNTFSLTTLLSLIFLLRYIVNEAFLAWLIFIVWAYSIHGVSRLLWLLLLLLFHWRNIFLSLSWLNWSVFWVKLTLRIQNWHLLFFLKVINNHRRLINVNFSFLFLRNSLSINELI
jgi:hypothetical protein